MTWFRGDDGIMNHPKVRQIPRKDRLRIVGLWFACGTWSSGQLTDGHIPFAVIEDFGGRRADAQTLAKVRLWHVAGHECPRCPQPEQADGYVFHDWPDWQPTREQILAERAAAAERQARLRKRRNGHRTTEVTPLLPEESHGVSPGTPSRPVPSEGLGIDPSSSHQPDAPEDRQTDDDAPSDRTLNIWAPGPLAPGVDLAAERDAFRAINAGRWRELRDVKRAWHGWLTKAAERARPTPTPSTPECPLHPGQPTGSKACPECAREGSPAPDLRALRGAS